MRRPAPESLSELIAQTKELRSDIEFVRALRSWRVLTQTGEIPLQYIQGMRNAALDLREISASGIIPASQIPDPTGHAGEILLTDGATAYWQALPASYSTWIANMATNGGTFAAKTKSTAARILVHCGNATYNTKIKYLLPFIGGNLAGARTPLIDNLGVGIATNHNFVEADFTEATGLKGNGVDKWLDPGFKPSDLGGGTNNGGVGWWQRDVSLAAGTQFGSGMDFTTTPPSETFGLRFGNSGGDINCEFYWGADTTVASAAELRSNAHYYGQRASATDRKLYKNAAQIAANTTNAAATRSSAFKWALFANNFDGTPLRFNAGACAAAYFTDGSLTATEISDFHSMLQTNLITPLGR